MYNDKREYYLTHGDRRHARLNGYDKPGENKKEENGTSAEKQCLRRADCHAGARTGSQ